MSASDFYNNIDEKLLPFIDQEVSADDLESLKHKEIITNLFDNQLKMVSKIYPTEEYRLLVKTKNTPPVLLTMPCLKRTQFIIYLINTYVRLIRTLPDNTLKNRAKRFFSRAPAIDPNKLSGYITQKGKALLGLTQFNNPNTGPLKYLITEPGYEANLNTYCKCYKILNYFVENKKVIPIEDRLNLLTDLNFLIQQFSQPEGTPAEQYNKRFADKLLETLLFHLNNSLTKEVKLPREESSTYQDIKNLIGDSLHKGGNGKARGSKTKTRGLRLTRHTHRKRGTRKNGRKKQK